MTENTLPQERPYQDDEIDLVELITNLWKEKWVIVICTGVITLLGLFYILFTKPTYVATTQIQPPLASSLAPLNNTQIINESPTTAFAQFLSILKSDAHRALLIQQEKNLLAELYGRDESTITVENINGDKLYSIFYPNLKKQENSLEPDIYTLEAEGKNRELIKQLIDNNINLAQQQLVAKWTSEFKKTKATKLIKLNSDLTRLKDIAQERRNNTITQLTEERTLRTKELNDELTARKSYVIETRKIRISELEEALKIAKTLNITQPSSLNRLANRSNSSQVEINNQQDPLYLRGTKLLSAELESLKSLPNTTFLDRRIVEIETELQRIKNNRQVEILKNRTSDIAFNDNLQSIIENIQTTELKEFPTDLNIEFQNALAQASEAPIKPKKILVLAISILLGGMIGFFVAIGRIVYKNAQKKLST